MSASPTDAFSPDELDSIARNLADTEELWESAQRETTVTVTCSECGGAGNTDQGSLGGGCWKCHGTGTITDEFTEAPLLELPGELKTLRLKYKGVRGLLDAHVASKIARKNAEELNAEFPDEDPVPVPPLAPAPTVADAADLVAMAAKIPDIRAAAKAAVQKSRRDHAGELGTGAEVGKLKRALNAAKQQLRTLTGGRKDEAGGGSLGNADDEDL